MQKLHKIFITGIIYSHKNRFIDTQALPLSQYFICEILILLFMKKITIYLLVIICAGFTSCIEEEDLSKKIDWCGVKLMFNNIKLKSGGNLYYPKNGPFVEPNGSVGPNNPITGFYDIYDLPAANLGNENVTSKIYATTTVDFNARTPDDPLSRTVEYDNHYSNYSNDTWVPNYLRDKKIAVWRSEYRSYRWQKVLLEFWSGPYLRISDNAVGTLYWTYIIAGNDIDWNPTGGSGVTYSVNNGKLVEIELNELQLEPAFKPIQSTPFISNIFINGALHEYQVKMIESVNGMQLKFIASI
jgi:hypothetical protein